MTNYPSIDLFYGDVGFTSDYSNVLQFDSASDRDTYFDNLEHINIPSTNMNRLSISNKSVKVAFDTTTNLGNLENINYCIIHTNLYGDEVVKEKDEYAFIIDYDVISSNENLTVVEFFYLLDVWQNFQFDFELKECNVDRCHCDRWSRNGSPVFRVCDDLYNSVSVVENKSDLKPTVENIYVNCIQQASGQILGTATNVGAKILWALMVVYTTQGNNPDRYVFTLFPITINPYDGEGNQGINYNIRNIRIPYAFNRSTSSVSFYPSLRDIENGNINQIVTSMFGSGSKIVNIQYLTDAPFKIKPAGGSSFTDTIFNYIYYGDDNYNNNTYMSIGLSVTGVSIPYLKNDLTTGTETASFELIALNEDMVMAVTEGNYYVDLPDDIVFPRVGTANENYEPMLFKSPIRKRYLMTKDGSNRMEIPDNFVNLITKKINAKVYASLNPTSAGELISLVDALVGNAGSFTSLLTAGLYSSVGFDGTVVNDVYMQYCINQRDTDRKMMMVNMATGGISDAGSTSISAGIGYRSNMERAELADISARLSPMEAMQQKDMYTKYAKQAAGMSVAGGMLQYGANALGTYMAQGAREVGIMNTPGSIVSASSIIAYINHTKDTKYWKDVVTVKCDDTTYQKYVNTFKKFGYHIGAVITPNIKSRKYFDYIKTNGAIITGSVNQSILNKIATIFDKGVTIWHMDNNDADSLYDYTNENIERDLIPSTYYVGNIVQGTEVTNFIAFTMHDNFVLHDRLIMQYSTNVDTELVDPDGNASTLTPTNSIINLIFERTGSYTLYFNNRQWGRSFTVV